MPLCPVCHRQLFKSEYGRSLWVCCHCVKTFEECRPETMKNITIYLPEVYINWIDQQEEFIESRSYFIREAIRFFLINEQRRQKVFENHNRISSQRVSQRTQPIATLHEPERSHPPSSEGAYPSHG